MNKKFFIIGISLSIFIILIALGGIFLFNKNNQKKITGRQPFSQEIFKNLSIKNESALNKLKKEVTSLDLPANEKQKYSDESQEITFLIPYNKNWGGEKYYLNLIENEINTVYFGNGGLYYAEMTPHFGRTMSFSRTDAEAYEKIKNTDDPDCGRPVEIKIGENTFLKRDECGMIGGVEYLLADWNAAYSFTYNSNDEKEFYDFLESVKHEDGTPFKTTFLANLGKSGTTTTFNYQNQDVNLTFSFPKRWGEPDFNYNTSTIDYNDPIMGWPEDLAKHKSHIIEIGQIAVGFSNSYHDPKICPNASDCGIWISLIPYDEQKNLMMDCYETSCSLSENLLLTKEKLLANANFKINNFPAILEDGYSTYGMPYRRISFFTPKYSVLINIYTSYPDINTNDDMFLSANWKELNGTKKINLDKLIEQSEDSTELKSVLQEFMNMVESLEIK